MSRTARLLFAALLAASWIAGTAPAASAALDPAVIKCRAAISKSAAKLANTTLKALIACHKARDKDATLVGTDCNAVASGDLKDKVALAETKLGQTVASKCTGVDPAAALFEICPAPCDVSVPTVTTPADVVSCLKCLNKQKVEAFADAAFGDPTPPLDKTEFGCHQELTRNSSRLFNAILKGVVKCQTAAEKAGQDSTEECTGAGVAALVDSQFLDGYTEIADGQCADVNLGGSALDPCGAATDVESLAYCVLGASRTAGTQVAGALVELSETSVTTTTTSTTTTTTLPVSDLDCPGSIDFRLLSRNTHTSCTDNTDCVAPRTCDVALGQCTSDTSTDLGWRGSGHDEDGNDGPLMRARLYCAGPAAPGCGECDVQGVDPADGACRCSNSGASCDSPGDASGDCRACVGGAFGGGACAADLDCWGGICAPRCQNNPAVICSSAADCPGSSCNLAATRCKNGVACASTSDCAGTCTGAAACECLAGTPTPVVSGGTPLCMVNYVSNLTGTVDVDLGAVDMTAKLRTSIYLGPLVTSPCPVCGGKCSNNAALGCVFDEDCGGSNTCVQDTPGDGNKNGICKGGASDGLSCDVNGVNASFPARASAVGGGGTSRDCLPSITANISGTGLPLTVAQTTGSSSLAAEVSCGGPNPGLDCPCLICSGNTKQVCNSDADCSSVHGFCSLAASVDCDADADCSSADVGPCVTVSMSHRCADRLTLVCSTNDDCDNVNVGTCTPSTCSSKGTGVNPVPNSCTDAICDDLGAGRGQCQTGPDDLYCDGVLKADGNPVFACLDNVDCGPSALGVDAGECAASERRSCFLDPIVAGGAADAGFPALASTFCVPPVNNTGVNTALGLPGPGRIVSQTATTAYCASNPLASYTPGVGGCP